MINIKSYILFFVQVQMLFFELPWKIFLSKFLPVENS